LELAPRLEPGTCCKGLCQAGVTVEPGRYPGMIHGFFQMTGLEGSRRLHRELGDWMREADQVERAAIGDEVTGA
jgi:acetyl esterase/lipase